MPVGVMFYNCHPRELCQAQLRGPHFATAGETGENHTKSRRLGVSPGTPGGVESDSSFHELSSVVSMMMFGKKMYVLFLAVERQHFGW